MTYHSLTMAAGQSRGCWRGRKDREVKRVLFFLLLCLFALLVLFWFDFLKLFLAVVTTGVQRGCRGTGKWMELGSMARMTQRINKEITF